MLDLTRPPPDRPASPALRVELHSEIWYRRGMGGVLEPVALREPGRPASASDAPAPRSGFHEKTKRDAVIRQVLNTTGPDGEWVDLPQNDDDRSW